jgi:nitrate reductase NapE component
MSFPSSHVLWPLSPIAFTSLYGFFVAWLAIEWNEPLCMCHLGHASHLWTIFAAQYSLGYGFVSCNTHCWLCYSTVTYSVVQNGETN